MAYEKIIYNESIELRYGFWCFEENLTSNSFEVIERFINYILYYIL